MWVDLGKGTPLEFPHLSTLARNSNQTTLLRFNVTARQRLPRRPGGLVGKALGTHYPT